MQKRRKSWQIKSLGVSREYTLTYPHICTIPNSLFRIRFFLAKVHTYVHADVFNVYTKYTKSIYITRAIYVSISDVKKKYVRVLKLQITHSK